MSISRISFIALLFAIIPGCKPPSVDEPKLPTVEMRLGTRTFQLEIAANDADRATGLMNRDSMAVDRGMIFVFADEAPRSFWMKNTRIPLDIVYVNATGEVVDIKQMAPFDLRSKPSNKPAKYAIELNKGLAAASSLKIGDQLTIPEAAKEPK
ncbi:MAG TPA: DUF192 domain-containing protein [Tepidisphaeraceae bacterium]|nr:DUF192 domain-containing protein [Tepidisphaeraceae bacterium]